MIVRAMHFCVVMSPGTCAVRIGTCAARIGAELTQGGLVSQEKPENEKSRRCRDCSFMVED
jgi:hypothetical protein